MADRKNAKSEEAAVPAVPAAPQLRETSSPAPSPRLLEFLVCPVTRKTLELSADRTELISRAARLAYPIRDGIPLLTTDTARELTDSEIQR